MDEPAAGPPTPAPVDWEWLVREARAFGVELAGDQVQSLRTYLDLLCDWNRRFNLTAIERPEEVLSKHLLDCLTCAAAVDFSRHSTLIDVGTGAGFPGLVLKIAYPHLRVTLLDSVQKRLAFLDRAARELGLEGIETVHARAEDAAGAWKNKPAGSPFLREHFDVVTARAVARLNVLVEWLLPLARQGGAALAMKGPDVAAEAAEAAKAIRLLGGGSPVITELQLPGADAGRSLVCIPKLRPTPRAYPRQAGAARKAPL